MTGINDFVACFSEVRHCRSLARPLASESIFLLQECDGYLTIQDTGF
jgi:hypothetical protein